MEDIIHLILINISLYRALLTPKPRSAKPHPPQRRYGGNRGLGIFPPALGKILLAGRHLALSLQREQGGTA